MSPHLITHPRHQRILQREFGLRGSTVAPHLESTIQPVALVATIPTDEWSDSPEIRRFSFAWNVTSDATHPAFLTLAAAAGTVTVVRSVFATGGGNVMSLGTVLTPPGGGAATGGAYLNRRVLTDLSAGRSASTVTVFTATPAPALNANFLVVDPALALQWPPPGSPPLSIVVAPGTDAVFLGMTAGNTETFRGGIQWDEIALTGER